MTWQLGISFLAVLRVDPALIRPSCSNRVVCRSPFLAVHGMALATKILEGKRGLEDVKGF